MKLKTIALAVALLSAGAVQAADQAPAPAPVLPATSVMAGQPARPIPQTPEAWLMRMTDFTQNMSAYKDPRVFVPWFNAVTEPGFYTAVGQGIMDPAGWLNMMNSMVHPNAYRNVAEFADPAITMRWLAATMDPAFYTAMLSTLTDPGKAMRWAMWPMDPKLWGLLVNMFNPNLYMKWGVAAMDPRAWTLMGNVMNPATYMGWMGAMMDPRSYGPSWGTFLNYQPAAPATATNPWGSTTGGTAGFNFFDPNALAGLMGGFGVPVPALPGVAAPAAPAAPAKAAEPGKPAEAAKPAAPATPVEPAKAAEPQKAAAAPSQKVVLSGDALFKLGKSGIRDLSAEGKQRLDEVAAKIKAMGDVEQIKIVGHADATGKPEANRRLSEARAKSVKSYLVAKGVKPGVIITSGMGDTQPVVQCDMKQPKDKLVECLAPNRRVEIEVVGKAK